MNLTKNIKIRILAFMMAFWLAFSVSYNDYQEVQALEWAIPTIAFDTALKFLLGLLGVSLTSKALHDNVDWSEVRQNCVDYQIQQGNDAVAVGEWWEDVIHGTLNQASDCWSAFKEWVSSKVSSGDDFVYASGSVYDVSKGLMDSVNVSYSSDYSISLPDTTTYGAIIYNNYAQYNHFMYFIFSDVELVASKNSNNSIAISSVDGSSFIYRFSSSSSTDSNYNINNIVLGNALTVSRLVISDFSNVSDIGLFSIKNESDFDFVNVNVGSSDGIFDSANNKIQDTAITTGDTTSTAIPDTLPLPWDNVSDTAEGVDDAISGLQEQVADGVLSLEDYWERVQELINALAIDTTTEETLPLTQNPDTGENETIQDKVEENVSNGTFTLVGMEKVFPFCIPWDIYAFVTLLVADPEAPVISYPFYNPITDTNINISIDFSDWETIVILFRYILDFLLIIGLLLLARQLSGAGGDD